MDETAIMPLVTDVTQAIPSQRGAPQAPPPASHGYMPPSRPYLARLIAQAREAHGKAAKSKAEFEYAVERAQAQAALSERRGASHKRVAVKYAAKGDTDVVDADKGYQFWKGEQERLCALIQAEYAMTEMMRNV